MREIRVMAKARSKVFPRKWLLSESDRRIGCIQRQLRITLEELESLLHTADLHTRDVPMFRLVLQLSNQAGSLLGSELGIVEPICWRKSTPYWMTGELIPEPEHHQALIEHSEDVRRLYQKAISLDLALRELAGAAGYTIGPP